VVKNGRIILRPCFGSMSQNKKSRRVAPVRSTSSSPSQQDDGGDDDDVVTLGGSKADSEDGVMVLRLLKG